MVAAPSAGTAVVIRALAFAKGLWNSLGLACSGLADVGLDFDGIRVLIWIVSSEVAVCGHNRVEHEVPR